MGERHCFLRITGRTQRVRLIEDRHSDDLFFSIRRVHEKSLNWRLEIELTEQFFNAGSDLLAFAAQIVEFVG